MASRLNLAPLPVETGRVLFDISRLLRGRASGFGTGVDRIDLAVGRQLLTRFGRDCGFVHAALGGPALIPHDLGAAILTGLDRRWRGEAADPAPRAGLSALIGRAQAMTGSARARATAETTYVVASHSGLARWRGALARLDPGRRMRRIAYIHDLIPLEYPEYQNARAAAGLARFLDELAAAPVRFVANSEDTARRLGAYAAARGWAAAGIAASRPWVEPGPPPAAEALRPMIRAWADGPPYFITLGTIEPRKNHLLLLTLWRELATEGRAPRLAVVGRRGWENEQIVDMLERCEAIRPHVAELGDLTDAEAQTLLRGARALLFPSFAEGLGVPLLEAAALGVPAIAADLPALREAAAPGAVFLSPLDGLGWKAEVLRRMG